MKNQYIALVAFLFILLFTVNESQAYVDSPYCPQPSRFTLDAYSYPGFNWLASTAPEFPPHSVTTYLQCGAKQIMFTVFADLYVDGHYVGFGPGLGDWGFCSEPTVTISASVPVSRLNNWEEVVTFTSSGTYNVSGSMSSWSGCDGECGSSIAGGSGGSMNVYVNCSSPNIVDTGPIVLCPGSSYNLTGDPDSGSSVTWSVQSGADKLTVNQEGLVTWSNYNQSNWGSDFTGKVRLTCNSTPSCYDEITIAGKGFKRPGQVSFSPEKYMNEAPYMKYYMGSEFEFPWVSGQDTITMSYQNNNDQCDGYVATKKMVLECTRHAIDYEINRTINDSIAGIGCYIAVYCYSSPTSSPNTIEEKLSVSHKSGSANITASGGGIGISIPLTALGGYTISGTWPTNIKNVTVSGSNHPHIAKTEVKLEELIELRIGYKYKATDSLRSYVDLSPIEVSVSKGNQSGITNLSFQP